MRERGMTVNPVVEEIFRRQEAFRKMELAKSRPQSPDMIARETGDRAGAIVNVAGVRSSISVGVARIDRDEE